MPNVLIYTRLSREDLGGSLARQEAACRAYADARGWTVLDVLCDEDVSAYEPHRTRPGFEALIAEARARTCDGVLVWKLDRLVRRPADFERLWEVAERRSVFVTSVMESIDSSTPLGVALLRILVALGGLESATWGVRMRARKRQTAELGTPPPVKAYGLTAAWDAVVAGEVAVLREAADRVIEGERVASVARDFRRRRVPSPTSGLWTDASLGHILRNPRLVGDRTYRGEVVAQNCWPAAFDRDYFARLQLALNHPYRRGAPRRHGPRLASGFVVCGLCGQKMNTDTRGGVRYFSCPTAPTGCGRVHVTADRLESWILDQLIDRLRGETPAEDASSPTDTAAAMRELCRDYYAARSITRDEFLSTRGFLVRQADAQGRASGRTQEVATVLSAADPRRALGRLELNVAREILAARLEQVEVGRFVGERRGVFDPARLRCSWRVVESATADP